MRVNQAGIDLIKRFEGCRLKAYQDSVGIWTIGYGITEGVEEGDVITQEQAEQRLEDELDVVGLGVQNLVEVPLNDNQFSALVCFAYNIGLGNLKKSKLLSLVNEQKFDLAAAQFTRWNMAGGKILQGLIDRRAAEAALFLA